MSSAPSQQSPLQRLDGTAVRVLVVDDEPNISELLSMALRYEGWDVRTAGTGSQAIGTAKGFRPDAVVLDMMLPDLDGLTVLRRMRHADEEQGGRRSRSNAQKSPSNGHHNAEN